MHARTRTLAHRRCSAQLSSISLNNPKLGGRGEEEEMLSIMTIDASTCQKKRKENKKYSKTKYSNYIR